MQDGGNHMNRQQKPERQEEDWPEPEIQQSAERSVANDERLTRAIRQHPQRDEPKMDSVELGDTPPP